MTTRLSADAARRIALAAQGFARPRPSGRVTRQHLRRVFADIGLIQVDSVNVLARSQELPLFARLGTHPRTLIPDAVAAGELFEYWAHVASILPTKHLPLFRWRMAAMVDGRYARHFTQRRPGMLKKVLDQVRDRGPIAVGDVEGRIRNPGTWWNWDDAKLALEILFDQGVVSVTRRPNDFARLYDLIERVVPEEVLAVAPIPEPDARQQLLLLAAESLGVATLKDLCDYYRLNVIDREADRRRPGGRRLPGRCRGRRMEEPGVSASRRCGATTDLRARPVVAVRLTDLVPRTHRAPVRRSTTGSRSTHRNRSGSTGTTYCRSSSTANSSVESISRPTVAPGSCGSKPAGSKTISTTPSTARRSPSSWPPSSPRWPPGWVSTAASSPGRGGNLAKDLLGVPNVMPIVEPDA